MGQRHLEIHEKQRLLAVLYQAFSYTVSMDEIDQVINEYKTIESKIKGRIAGDIQDLLLNFFIRRFANQTLPGPSYTQCEIGVLFGGSTILGYKAIKDEKERNTILVIDPLDGFYMGDPNVATVVDEFSNCEVTVANLKHNLEVNDVDLSLIEILQDYSTNTSCIEKVKNKDFSFLFIDGDHTETGIKNDWVHFASRVVDKGIVVIDNINDWPWREVNLFLHKLLNNENSMLNGWGVKAFYRRTVVLQKGVPHDDVIYEALRSSMNYSYHSIIAYNKTKAPCDSNKGFLSRLFLKVIKG